MKTIYKNRQLPINVLIAFFATLYSFRAYFYGYILGDEYDTRLMISQHEHWYRLFLKNGVFRDTLYFYPTQNALGFTDSFLIPSFFYVPIRAIGLGILQSWSIATFIALLIGFLGWLVLFTKLIDNFYLRLLLFFNITLYPAWVAQFEYFPNALGYAYSSWIILIILKIYEHRKDNTVFRYINILIFITVLLMLTSWYPAFFLIFISLFTVIKVLKDNRKIESIKKNLKVLNIKDAVLAFINLLLVGLWLFIYVPKFLETASLRNWSEVAFHSVTLRELLNPINLHNGIVFVLFKSRNIDLIEERNLGFSIGLSVSLAIILICILFNFKVWKKSYYEKEENYRFLIHYLLLPSLFLGLIFLKLTDEFSLYKLFWSVVPGFTSIRYPYRFYFILGMVFWIFIFMTLNIYLKNKTDKSRRLALFILLIAITLDNLKPYYSFWKAEDYLPNSLYKQINFLQNNCDYFILDRPGGWWDDATKAIALSAISGVPTSNGQSSGFPAGYPIKPQLYEGDISEMLKWSQFGISEDLGCFVSDNFLPILSNPNESRMEIYDGFSLTEKNKNNYWNWATSAKATLFVSLPKDKEKTSLEFTLKTPPCIEERNLTFIALPNTELSKVSVRLKETTFKINLMNNDHNLIKIEITTDDKFCRIGEDPRTLFYEIKNYKIS